MDPWQSRGRAVASRGEPQKVHKSTVQGPESVAGSEDLTQDRKGAKGERRLRVEGPGTLA